MSEQAKARQLRRRMIITLVFVLLALIMVIICAVSGAFNFHKGTNVMPDVIGMKEEEAVAAIDKLDATASVSYMHSEEPEGTVISQGVEAGGGVTHNSTVSIVVSMGPEKEEPASAKGQITLPNLVGLSMDLAESTAEQLGVLIVEDGTVNDDYIPYGSVAEQEPEGGTVVKEGSVVKVKLSAGPSVIYYNIYVNCGEGGSVSPAGETISREEGSDVTVYITPNEGYEIDVLIVDGEQVNPLSSYHFLDLQENHSLTVTFKEKATGVMGLIEQIFGQPRHP